MENAINKYLGMIALFIIVAGVGFWLGMKYEAYLSSVSAGNVTQNTSMPIVPNTSYTPGKTPNGNMAIVPNKKFSPGTSPSADVPVSAPK